MSNKQWVINGITLTAKEIERFQQYEQDSLGENLLNKLLTNYLDITMSQLKSLGSSGEAVRQAQGGLAVVERIVDTIGKVSRWDINQDEKEEEEEEVLEDADVSF